MDFYMFKSFLGFCIGFNGMVLEEFFDFCVFCVVESLSFYRDVVLYFIEDMFFYVCLCFRFFLVLYDDGYGIKVEDFLIVYEKMFGVVLDLFLFGFDFF